MSLGRDWGVSVLAAGAGTAFGAVETSVCNVNGQNGNVLAGILTEIRRCERSKGWHLEGSKPGWGHCFWPLWRAFSWLQGVRP